MEQENLENNLNFKIMKKLETLILKELSNSVEVIMKAIFSLIIYTSLFGCVATGKNTQNELKSFFNESEIKELKIISDEFDKQLLSNFGVNELEKSYFKFFVSIEQAKTSDEFILKISFIDMGSILEKINTNVLSLIWELDSLNQQGLIEIKSLRLKGPYADFLKLYGKENSILKEYFESIEISGDVSPFSIGLLRTKARQLNISDSNIRLILAIHYLSIRINKC
jgi:hypothetical protein